MFAFKTILNSKVCFLRKTRLTTWAAFVCSVCRTYWRVFHLNRTLQEDYHHQPIFMKRLRKTARTHRLFTKQIFFLLQTKLGLPLINSHRKHHSEWINNTEEILAEYVTTYAIEIWGKNIMEQPSLWKMRSHKISIKILWWNSEKYWFRFVNICSMFVWKERFNTCAWVWVENSCCCASKSITWSRNGNMKLHSG